MRTKRLIDIVAGSALAVLALPLVLLLALGCAVALRTWPLFVQRRVGRHGRLFAFPKLRTLPRSTPAAVDKYAIAATPIPAYCRMLRRSHLDELPQLFLVPIGRMSLVGPRPEMPELLHRYPSDLVARRTSVRPGCTGLWQVSRAADQLIYEAPEYDLAYLEHAGLRLDGWILYRTARSWVAGADALGLHDVPQWVWSRPDVAVRADVAAAAPPLSQPAA
jgi:lipopolysaccharide/colanic/teichoic acid biosynthesis glycosyltransferase